MILIILVLLVLWLGMGVIGFVVKGLLWLAVIGIVLFLVTAAWGWLTQKKKSGTPS
ncbi:hypothetical protein [Nakamurella lactea]|uniref:hypothetical protein n=1 Tax=Nakamurella lactea TaxID=459515 RepID=UPI00041E1FAF|nr:hypothetical protein [Nakamurella lactea]